MMNVKSEVLTAFRLMFRPLARILLRAGVTWKELTEVVKATYVEVASKDFGLQGRPTNVSRVSILTGLTRREVRRLRELLDGSDPQAFQRMNNATRLLSGWYQDPDFSDGEGNPLLLVSEGTGASFQALSKRYAGDIPATTMLKELLHVGAVEEAPDRRLRARTRYYMPALLDADAVLRSGSVVDDLGTTVAYNLHRDSTDPSRFERRATNTRIPQDAIPEFREFLETQGQAFLERVDAWLTEHEGDDTADPGQLIRLGAGTYWIEDNSNEGNES